MTATDEFTAQANRFRGELLAHCYRMLGSAEEAEDAVQETYLRAWRSYGEFEGRSSVRTWLYRIATNACLTAIERRSRRPLPSGLGAPSDDPTVPLLAAPNIPWLRPLPDALLASTEYDPAAVTASRAGTRLAMVAALQYLPPRQRAMLILRDVLEWPAAEVAELLDTTSTAVNSGVRRARAQLARALPAEDQVAEPDEPERRAMLDRLAAAFETGDVAAMAELLSKDVALEMPPMAAWFAGRDSVLRFLAATVFARPATAETAEAPDLPALFRVVPVQANAQPAFALYERAEDGVYRAHGVLVPSLRTATVRRLVVFLDPNLLGLFGLPAEHGSLLRPRATTSAVPAGLPLQGLLHAKEQTND